MAKATTTIRQVLTHEPHHGAWFAATKELFNRIAAFYFEVIQAHEGVLALSNKEALTALEGLTHATERNPHPSMPLTAIGEDIPAIFRRAAINAALGSARSFYTHLARWRKRKEQAEAKGKKCTLRPPVPPRTWHKSPSLYGRSCYGFSLSGVSRMSILDKKLPQTPVRKSRGKVIIISIILVVLVLILLVFTDISNDVALVAHFFVPPSHFTYHGHSGYVSAVAWSPDGKRIASASGDGTVQIWNAFSGTALYTYRGHDKDVFCLAWSPDGRYIASGGLDTTVQVWDAGNGNRVYTYHSHTDAVFSVAWSPDGTRIASASEDGTVQVWDAMTGGNVFTFRNSISARGSPVPWNTVAWSPDGKRIAVGGNGDIQVWDAASGKNVVYYGYHGGVARAVIWSPDGRYLAVGRSDGTVQVWDVAAVRNVYTYSGHTSDVLAVAWNPDGKRIASASADGTVQVWDTFTGDHAYVYRGHADFALGHFTPGAGVNSVAWSPDGTHIASAGTDGTVQVWPDEG